MKFFSIVITTMLAIGFILALLVYNQVIPQSYLPWTPLNLDEEPNFLTEYKLAKLDDDYAQCRKALSSTALEYQALPDKKSGNCRLSSTIHIQKSNYPYSQTVKGRCALIAGLYAWEKHILRKSAEKHLSSDIAEIRHYGIFSCRNIAGSNRISQHASANAIDIAGFKLKDGTSISVQNDWGKNTDKGHFLQDVNDNSCRLFRGVLGPRYNSNHADHFHLDMGPYQICR